MIAEILDWAANEGFKVFMQKVGDDSGLDTDWDSAHQFRQRYLVEALIKSRGPQF